MYYNTYIDIHMRVPSGIKHRSIISALNKIFKKQFACFNISPDLCHQTSSKFFLYLEIELYVYMFACCIVCFFCLFVWLAMILLLLLCHLSLFLCTCTYLCLYWLPFCTIIYYNLIFLNNCYLFI